MKSILILLIALIYNSNLFKSEIEMSSATFKNIKAKFILEIAMSPKQNPSRRTPFVLIYNYTENFFERFDPNEIGDDVDLNIWSGLCQFRQQKHDFINLVPINNSKTSQFDSFVNNTGITGGNNSNNWGIQRAPDQSETYPPLWRYRITLSRNRLYRALAAAVSFDRYDARWGECHTSLTTGIVTCKSINGRNTEGAYGQPQRKADYAALVFLRSIAELEITNPAPVNPNPKAPKDPTFLPLPL